MVEWLADCWLLDMLFVYIAYWFICSLIDFSVNCELHEDYTLN